MSPASPRRILDAIRAADWWAYKIPPLLVTVYAGFLRFPTSLDDWSIAARALVAILCIAVFGYVQNDICDIDADRRAGRPNRMAGLGVIARMLWMLVPAAMALALVGTTGDRVMVALVAANLLVPTLYSVPPVRLKGRGLAGALADAAGVHALPMALVSRAVTIGAPDDVWTSMFIVTAIGWATFAGLRGILVHQVVDRDADAAADVTTFGGRLGAAGTRPIVMRVLLPAEVASLVLFLAPLVVAAPVLILVFVLYLAAESVKVQRGWTLPLFDPTASEKEAYVPVVNNEIYEMWLPVALAVQLALMHLWLWLLVAAHVYLFLPNLRVRWGITLKTSEPSL